MSVITKTTYSEPNQKGYFGAYGGKFVPETLIPALNELEKAYKEPAKILNLRKSISTYYENMLGALPS